MLPWDHNAYYQRLLLRAVPVGAQRVLEIGCGTGQLAVRLSGRADHVDALDRDPTMIAAARERVPGNVTCLLADAETADLGAARYDAVVSLSTLHHLALPRVLPRLADALRPGGTLAVVALPRRDLPRELPVELAATTVHHLIGAALAVGGDRTSWGRRLVRDDDHDLMPMRDPTLTTAEVRRRATEFLPGARVRRLLLWRYLLTWRRPGAASAA